MSLEFIPCYTIKNDSLVLWTKVEGLVRKPNNIPLSNIRVKAGLSNKSADRLKECIKNLYAISKKKSIYQKSTEAYFQFKVNFITLTLPSKQIHPDKEIHKLIFEPFIRRLRIQYKGFMYVYKAEVQDNGNLHYHLNTNVFIHHEDLRTIWNKCCNKLGYVTRSGIKNPNSTDVKAVKNKTILSAYMAKYISKKDLYTKKLARWHRINDKYNKVKTDFCTLPRNYFASFKRKIDIKLWDCSLCLKNIKHSVEGITNLETDDINTLAPLCRYVALDYVTIMFDIDFRNKDLKIFNKLWFEMFDRARAIEKESLKFIEIQ